MRWLGWLRRRWRVEGGQRVAEVAGHALAESVRKERLARVHARDARLAMDSFTASIERAMRGRA